MHKNASRKPFYLRPVPIVVTAAMLCFAAWLIFAENGIVKQQQLHEVWVQQNEEIRFREAQKKKLEATVAALREKDDQAMETAARDFGLVAPDEKIYEIKLAIADTTK